MAKSSVSSGGPYFGVGTSPVTLAGFVPITLTPLWTTSGTGTFADPADVGTTYTPSPADVAAWIIDLTLTGDDGINPPISSITTLTLTPATGARREFLAATTKCRR